MKFWQFNMSLCLVISVLFGILTGLWISFIAYLIKKLLEEW